MKCKYCDMDNIEWPENYVKGCRPIETETGTTHDMKRCKEIQNTNIVKSDKWYRVNCIECGNLNRRNPKYNRKPDPLRYICNRCDVNTIKYEGEID